MEINVFISQLVSFLLSKIYKERLKDEIEKNEGILKYISILIGIINTYFFYLYFYTIFLPILKIKYKEYLNLIFSFLICLFSNFNLLIVIPLIFYTIFINFEK